LWGVSMNGTTQTVLIFEQGPDVFVYLHMRYCSCRSSKR